MKQQGRLARLQQEVGMIRCPHCRSWIGPDAQRRTEEEEQNRRLWEAATLEELRQVRDSLAALRARVEKAEAEGIGNTR
jgi:hypothetical protein